MKNYRELTSPCGIDCFNCELYIDNISEAMLTRLAPDITFKKELVACRGCREEKGCKMVFSVCSSFDCIQEHQVEFCFECDEFPCERLQPTADGAEKYPHNMKMYNLCRIQKVGVEKWAKEEALNIREKYFRGTFKVGCGPMLREKSEKVKKRV